MKTLKLAAVAALTLLGSVPSAFSAVKAGPHRVKAPLPEITAVGAPTGEFKPVNTLPEGAVATTMVKSGAAYIMVDPTYSVMQRIDGFVAEVATLGNQIYVGPIISQADFQLSYMVGTVEDGIATFEFPQALGYYAYTGDKDYAVIYKLVPNGEGFSLQMADEQTIKFAVKEDGGLELLPDYYSSYIVDAGYEDGNWYHFGIGDVLLSCTPLTAETVKFPEGVALEEYNLVSGSMAYKVNVAVDGEEIYISGIYRDLPDGIIKGELKDGKAVFPGEQYLGIDDYFHCCVNIYACSIEEVDDEDLGVGVMYKQIPGDFEFNVNSDLSELTLGDTPVCFSPAMEMIGILTSMEECLISKPDPNAEILVSKPIIDTYDERDSQYYAQLFFSMVNVSADGKQILDEDKLYWTLYFDDEPYTFEPDEYAGLTVPVDYLPYKFSNGQDIIYFASYGLQGLIIYPEGFDSLGVQAIYKDGDREYRSEIAYAVGGPKEENSISAAEAPEVTVDYFDLSGRRVGANGSGLMIKRTVNAAGDVKTVKIIK